MELRSGAPRRKNMPLRILLASIGLTAYAAALEEHDKSIEQLAEMGEKELKKITKAPKADLTKMRASALEYVERHNAGIDPQKQLELDMMGGAEEDEALGMDDGLFGGLDLQAEIDALKSDGLFGGSPGSSAGAPAPEFGADESDGSWSDSSDEAPPPPQPKPPPKPKPAPKQTKKDKKTAKRAEEAKKGGQAPPAKAQPAAAGKKATKVQPTAAGKKAGKKAAKSSPSGGQGGKADGGKQNSPSEGGKRQGGNSRKKRSEAKRGSNTQAPAKPCTQRLRELFPADSVVPTLAAIRKVMQMLFTFYCANWGIAACARWVEYNSGRQMQLSNWFMKQMLMFAVPRPPLYPVPLYLCLNAVVDVLEQWAKKEGRFQEGTQLSVKVIGISLYACDIGAVLYGGCFLLTGTTHCLALATGTPFEKYLAVDEFLLPRPPMSPLLGYGAVMVGCVVLEQLQVWVEQMLTRRGGFRKFLRTHGVHIVLMFILLPIIGTFLAGISVFVGGLMSDLASSTLVMWPGGEEGGAEDDRPGPTLARFFGPAFGRETYIKFTFEDIETSFAQIDSNRNLVLSPSEFNHWLGTQQLHALDSAVSGGRASQISDALKVAAIGSTACRHNNLKSTASGLDYSCYCSLVVSAVEEYYGEAYDADRHDGCKTKSKSGGGGSKSSKNLGYTVACTSEQEAKAIHDFLTDHSSLKHGSKSPKSKGRPDLRNYPELTIVREESAKGRVATSVGIRTSLDLKAELGYGGPHSACTSMPRARFTDRPLISRQGRRPGLALDRHEQALVVVCGRGRRGTEAARDLVH